MSSTPDGPGSLRIKRVTDAVDKDAAPSQPAQAPPVAPAKPAPRPTPFAPPSTQGGAPRPAAGAVSALSASAAQSGPAFQQERVRDNLFVVGRKSTEPGALLRVGRYRGPDGSLGFDVFVDASKPHVVLICGKRGYGKSYTMGTFLEEFCLLETGVRERVAAVVMDTLGVFWTMKHPNTKQAGDLSKWGLAPMGFPMKVYTQAAAVQRFRDSGIEALPFRIPLKDLDAPSYCSLFDIHLASPTGLTLARVLEELAGQEFDFDDMEKMIEKLNPRPEIRDQLLGMVGAIKGWGIFAKTGNSDEDFLNPGKITIVDLSPFTSESIKVVISTVLGRRFFEYRVRAKKEEDTALMHNRPARRYPLVWMVLDEAQVFLPSERRTPATDVYIAGWMRQGRQPGLGLILATQRVAAMDPEVLSHSDILFCHRVTAEEDIQALNKVRPAYMQGSVGDGIRKLGTERGMTLVIDDTSEATHNVRIRPRMSWHGGAEPNLLEERDR